jgi:2-polyprenyl-6-methoxyphenol hydroxylase-like FAD-dependent oxidoreductase
MSETTTTCVIVGCGPAGMVAGLLLARGAVQVMVLEKHKDFLRDFRGDTLHPSTIQLLDELGLYEEFTALPQLTRSEKFGFDLADGHHVTPVDFTRLPVKHRYLALAPQWDMLGMLADAAKKEPTFTLRMSHEVTGLLREATGRITGVRYTSPDGGGEIRADLTLVCDGCGSLCRREARPDHPGVPRQLRHLVVPAARRRRHRRQPAARLSARHLDGGHPPAGTTCRPSGPSARATTPGSGDVASVGRAS